MKRCLLICLSLWVVFSFQGAAHAMENNSKQTSCWIDISNLPNTQLKAPCAWKKNYSFEWEGGRWRVDKDSYVIDGDGVITLHRKDGFQSVRYKTQWLKGKLNSDFNVDPSKFFKCTDESCDSVELPIKGGAKFQGRVTFNADKTDFQFSGEGRLSAPGFVYQGEIKTGNADGLGRICIAPQGSTLPSLPDDFDEDDCSAPNLFADGYWEDSKFQNGYIRQIYRNGMVYEGGFSDGLVENYGTSYWPDGARYQGDLADGKRNGVGTFQYSDGSIYEGKWRDGVKSGAGVLLIKPKKIKYIGEWENGTYQGDGTMEFADKSSLIGAFYNGKPNGECLFLSANKELFQTVWQNGELVFFRPLANANSQTSVSFNLIPSANAGVFGYLSDTAKSMAESLKAGVNAAHSFVQEAYDHPEYRTAGLNGCFAGAPGAALMGAAGGAAIGSIVPGVGTSLGATLGAGFEGLSGCWEQGKKAYIAKKTLGKDFLQSDVRNAFMEELSLDHLAYGMLDAASLGLAKVVSALLSKVVMPRVITKGARVIIDKAKAPYIARLNRIQTKISKILETSRIAKANIHARMVSIKRGIKAGAVTEKVMNSNVANAFNMKGVAVPLQKILKTFGISSLEKTLLKDAKYISKSGKLIAQRNSTFFLHVKDALGRTNIERMKQGLPPIGKDEKPVELHHLKQQNNGMIIELTSREHNVNSKVLHSYKRDSEIDRRAFNIFKRKYWQERTKDFE